MIYVLLATVGIFLAVTVLIWLGSKVMTNGVARYQTKVIATVQASLEENFLFINSKRLLLITLTSVVCGGISIWFLSHSILLAFIFTTLLLAAPGYFVCILKKRRLKKIAAQLPDALTMISGSLRAGSSLNNALVNLAAEARPPISQEFALLVREQRLGMSLDNALANMEKRVPSDDFILVLAAIRIAKEVGGNLAETLERLADTLRRKATMEGKIQSLTAQGKLQGIVISLLPLALAAVLFWIDAEKMRPLFTTPIGMMVCAVLIVFETLGALLIRKVVTIDV